MTRHRRLSLFEAGIMEDYFLLIFNTHISFSRATAVRQLTLVVLPTTFFEIGVCVAPHLPRFQAIKIEALSIRKNLDHQSGINPCGRENLFRVESHVFAGEEFESKGRLHKFPRVKPICSSEYFHISRYLFLFRCVSQGFQNASCPAVRILLMLC